MSTKTVQVRKERRSMNAVSVQCFFDIHSGRRLDDYAFHAAHIKVQRSARYRMDREQPSLHNESTCHISRKIVKYSWHAERVRIPCNIELVELVVRINNAVTGKRIVFHRKESCRKRVKRPI